MDNDWKKRLGVVYSTDPGFQFEGEREKAGETPGPSQQKLYVSLDRKNRKGKVVTLVEGFTGNEQDLKELGKELKSKCGSGGTAKDGEIIIQGDFRDRVVKILKDKGYGVKQKGGS
jgi:translation initiation factor 1